MKIKYLSLFLISLLITGCNDNNIPPEEIKETDITYTITTSGADFGIQFPTGTHFNIEEKVSALSIFINNQIESGDTIISTNNLHTMTWKDCCYLEFGSGSNPVGSLTISNLQSIKAVTATVLCYAKYDSYHQVTNVDNQGHFLIDDVDKNLSYDGLTDPQEVTINKNYDTLVDTFTLSSYSGRVLLKSISITVD